MNSDVEKFRRSLLRLRGDQRETVLVVFEQLFKARLFKNSKALSRALNAMWVALGSWGKGGHTMQDHAAMEAIFDLIEEARPLRQKGAYQRETAQRNQEWGDRKAKIMRPQFLEAFRRHQGTLKTDAGDTEIAKGIAREFQVDRETVERRIRRYRAQGILSKRRSREGSRQKKK